jgi:NurA domain.
MIIQPYMEGMETFKPDQFGKEVLLQKNFFEFMEKIRATKIELPKTPEIRNGVFNLDDRIEGTKITREENDTKFNYSLDLEYGHDVYASKQILISAYDESIAAYSALEGKVFLVSHALTFIYGGKYYPLNKLTLMFVTGSKKMRDKIPGAIAPNPKWGIDTTANVEIAQQKKDFLKEYSHNDSILLIDGPFLAGDGMATFKGIIKETFIERNIIPVFIVKNSNSNLLVDSIDKFRGEYNSDLHLVNELLKEGERSPFYKYTDEHSSDNSKIFCYVKVKEHSSPIRVEFPTIIYKNNEISIKSVMDLIYYLIMVQGDFSNPQVRPIAIAEKYARETLGLINFNKTMIFSELTATMNEKRGMEY